MKPDNVKKKLKTLDIDGVKLVIAEAIQLAMNSSGIQYSSEMAYRFITLLENNYKKQLAEAGKQPVVGNVDLEDSIIECLKEKENK